MTVDPCAAWLALCVFVSAGLQAQRAHPFISNYAFWVLMGAYLLLAGRK
jgi:hypothetical protein